MARVTKVDTDKIEVSYPVREAIQVVTKAEYDLVRMESMPMVTIVKFIRGQYNLGLFEAKNIVDTIRAQPEAVSCSY